MDSYKLCLIFRKCRTHPPRPTIHGKYGGTIHRYGENRMSPPNADSCKKRPGRRLCKQSADPVRARLIYPSEAAKTARPSPNSRPSRAADRHVCPVPSNRCRRFPPGSSEASIRPKPGPRSGRPVLREASFPQHVSFISAAHIREVRVLHNLTDCVQDDCKQSLKITSKF